MLYAFLTYNLEKKILIIDFHFSFKLAMYDKQIW